MSTPKPKSSSSHAADKHVEDVGGDVEAEPDVDVDVGGSPGEVDGQSLPAATLNTGVRAGCTQQNTTPSEPTHERRGRRPPQRTRPAEPTANPIKPPVQLTPGGRTRHTAIENSRADGDARRLAEYTSCRETSREHSQKHREHTPVGLAM